MTRVRRLVAGAAIAGAILIPFSFSTARPAVAYCADRPIDDGGSGCSNPCQDTGKVLTKVGLGGEWYCPM